MKSKLALVLGLVETLTLGTAVLLYVGARCFEDDARLTREANRELLAVSLSARAYMDAFGRSLSQRTPDADRARLDAAASFQIEASIRVKSELGKGSEFTVLMPRCTLVLI